MLFLRSLIAHIICVLWLGGASAYLVILKYVFNASPRTMSNVGQCIHAFILKLYGIRVQLDNLENFDINKPCVIVANHSSLFDLSVMYGHLKGMMRAVTKAELFKIPVFGQMCKAVGMIPIERNNKESAKKAMSGMQKLLEDNMQILIYPEGTRSKDGKLGVFKKGAFRIAVQMQVPVVVVALKDTYKVMQKNSLKLGKHRDVGMKVFKPIDVSNLKDEPEDILKLSNQAREMIESYV